MAAGKVHPILPSFTTGELSPLMYGRVDFAKFASGLEVLLNYIVRPHGPVSRRAGSHFIAEVKNSAQFTRLLRFEFSTTQAYQIEAGNLYFRFYKNGGQINDGINVTISNVVANGTLIRVTATAHGYSTGNGVVISGVVGVPIANQIWPQITVIDANTFDLVGSTFAGTYTSGGTVNKTVEVATPYLSADLPLLKYAQNADTMYIAHPSYPVYKLTRQSHTQWTMAAVNFLPPMTYEAGYSPAYTLTLGATSGFGVSITAGAGGDFQAGDVGRMIVLQGTGAGRAIIRTVATATTGTADIIDAFASVGPFAASTGWTMMGSPQASLTPSVSQPIHQITTLTTGTTNCFRAGDVGSYVRVNHGVCRITVFNSATSVNAEILDVLTNASASPAGSWSIETSEWNATRGYPGAVCFHQQRLVLAGNTARPQAFWGSNPGLPENFPLGPDDDDAYEFLIATNDVNAINWLLPTRVLLMGTASSEFSVETSPGSTNASITPNNVNVKTSTAWGSNPKISPIRVGLAGLFVTRYGTEFREMVYSLQRDSYVADDLLLLAEHLTKGAAGGVLQITDMAYQRHPAAVVWCVRSDGTLLGLTYQREHDVVGWHRQITGPDVQEVTPVKGKYEAVITTPHWNLDRDVVFFIVNRTVNGNQKRYIEYADDLNGYYGTLGMDCALTYSGAPTASVTGLYHLIGETVKVLGDGAVYPDQVVDSTGTIQLQGLTCSKVEAGLNFNSKLRTMRIEVGNAASGTSQGIQKHWSKIWVRLTNTIGGFINGREIPFRGATDITGQALPLFSGDKFADNTTTDRGGQITIEQRQPLPQTINAIFGEMSVGQ